MSLDYERELYSEVVDEALDRLGLRDRVSYSDIAFIGNLVAEAAGVHRDYAPPVESPYPGEIKRLEKELRAERDKVGCHECKGTGRIEGRAGPWFTNSQCDRCHGEGKHKP